MKTIFTLIGILLLILLFLLLITIVRTLLLKQKTSVYHGSDDDKRSNDYALKLQKMIKVDTVSIKNQPDPDKFRKLHKVMEKLFPNVFKTCEKHDIDGNLLVRWPGRNSKMQPIVLTSHLDVVAAEGDWTYPPFEGKIVDGKIYGRGSFDVKCGVFSFYQAVEELIKDGYVPECDIYLASSCTEEVGGDGAPKMSKWFEDHKIRPFMLCDEGGCITEDPFVGVKGNFAAVGIFEKGYGDIKIIAKGNGGHSSAPGKNTPIARLAKFEAEIEKKSPFKVEFTPAVDSLLLTMAEYCSNFWIKMILHNLWLFKPLLKIVMPAISPQGAAMLQTTMCFTMQKGSNGYNVIPQEAYVTANMRYIPFQGKDESIQLVKDIAKKYDLEVEELGCSEPSSSLDLNGPQYKMVKDTINKIFPSVEVIPYIVTGGTDSRFYDRSVDACVRFEPINSTKDQLSRMHGIDENIDINTLPLAVDFYKEIIRKQEER
ncbi:MAG: M20/M25/M40 family metallo-hydrolase [Erysipelotrichaceae bacterium]|nr:M20/M25/M40 family metallo-hydrolase [Erysipelotrichaceae bacterium]